jgi:TonB family protein
MKQIVKSIWILILLVGFSSNLRASDKVIADSIKITQIVNDFYDWYLTSIKEKKYHEFKPRFVESTNGMTTLDYSSYLDNLKIHGFSDTLIKKEKQSYSDCIDNLGKVKHTDFQNTIFTDLDEFVQTNCDFGNYYRWTGGQEPIEGIRITHIKFVSKNVAMVSLEYYETDKRENIKHYWGNNFVTLRKLNNKWKIDSIDSWKKDNSITSNCLDSEIQRIKYDTLASYLGYEYYCNDSVICSSEFDTTDNREIFYIVDKMPVYEDSISGIINYIQNNIRYPNIQTDIIARVFIRFIVEENGNLTNIKILRGIDPLLDNEAIRVIQNMPNWRPGECNGKKVPVYFTVPVRFGLQ